jgi:DNA mismatch endonuclease, patch repair protein
MRETVALRSRIMRAVKGTDTAPEIKVRRMVHRMGYRFRVHRKDLPGKPDLVFPRLHKVVFVHGCFWHGHSCARGARVPKKNRAYWVKKVAGNRARDRKNLERLASGGWNSLVVWECDTRDDHDLGWLVEKFLRTKWMHIKAIK